MKALIEQLADAEHSSWGHWMSYLFSVSQRNEDGTYTIPADKAQHWQRQMCTTYDNLSEREKQSDRDEVEKILPFIEAARNDWLGDLEAVQKAAQDFLVCKNTALFRAINGEVPTDGRTKAFQQHRLKLIDDLMKAEARLAEALCLHQMKVENT